MRPLLSRVTLVAPAVALSSAQLADAKGHSSGASQPLPNSCALLLAPMPLGRVAMFDDGTSRI